MMMPANKSPAAALSFIAATAKETIPIIAPITVQVRFTVVSFECALRQLSHRGTFADKYLQLT